MKTFVKTSIKSYENLNVTNTLDSILKDIASKNTFIKLNVVSHDGKQNVLAIRKTYIKLVKKLK